MRERERRGDEENKVTNVEVIDMARGKGGSRGNSKGRVCYCGEEGELLRLGGEKGLGRGRRCGGGG